MDVLTEFISGNVVVSDADRREHVLELLLPHGWPPDGLDAIEDDSLLESLQLLSGLSNMKSWTVLQATLQQGKSPSHHYIL